MDDSERRPVGRPRSLTDERVADAIIACGFTDLKAVDVAERLAVNPATLYRHVSGHAEMVDLAVSRLVSTTDWPTIESDWREYLETVTWTLWHLVRSHPGLATASPAVGITNPQLMALYSGICLDLIAAGFAPADAGLAVDFVLDLAIDSLKMRETLAAQAAADPTVETWYRNLDEGLAEAMRESMHGDPATWFGRKLEVALDGIEHVLAP
ncbi:hypothetical protein [Plantibacter sp. YIM 135347]|uniref:hypothetical protein n=1 Tax=Plantibacter sp. YIM 135347 TaxID=3423919 RepID=UPI003D32A209